MIGEITKIDLSNWQGNLTMIGMIIMGIILIFVVTKISIMILKIVTLILALCLILGSYPSKKFIYDHINKDKLDSIKNQLK